MLNFDTDLTEFESALRLYQDATNKAVPDILNRAAVNIAFKAMAKTKMTPVSKIRKHDPTKRPEKRNTRLLYAVTAKARAGSTDGGRAAKEFAKRNSSRGYIKAGWAAVIRLAGKSSRVEPSPAMLQDSEFNAATVFKRAAEIANGAKGAEKVGLPALQAAVKIVSKDMETYALKKMGKIARDHSAK